MDAMKSSIAEVMWKRMMKAKIINMADGGTENQKQENLKRKEKRKTHEYYKQHEYTDTHES